MTPQPELSKERFVTYPGGRDKPEHVLSVQKREDGLNIVHWKLSWKERLGVLFKGNIYLSWYGNF